MAISRRLGLIAGAGSLLGVRRATAQSSGAPAWMRKQGAPAAGQPYGVPSPFEKDVIRRTRGVPNAAAAGQEPVRSAA
jgi:sulfane dehydrogenase subunit SoxC